MAETHPPDFSGHAGRFRLSVQAAGAAGLFGDRPSRRGRQETTSGRRDRIVRRWRSVNPPHTPNSIRLLSASTAQSSRTGHRSHTRFARCCAAPCTKSWSGSPPRQAPNSAHGIPPTRSPSATTCTRPPAALRAVAWLHHEAVSTGARSRRSSCSERSCHERVTCSCHPTAFRDGRTVRILSRWGLHPCSGPGTPGSWPGCRTRPCRTSGARCCATRRGRPSRTPGTDRP